MPSTQNDEEKRNDKAGTGIQNTGRRYPGCQKKRWRMQFRFTIEFRNTVKPDPEKEFMIMMIMLMKCR
jgi:predicted secreted Zn-dependent protease